MEIRKLPSSLVVLLALVLGFVGAASTPALAIVNAPIVVTTTADSGTGSLRAAIDSANTNSGADTITFSALFDSAQTISLDTALPAFTSNITVTGTGAKLLTVKDKVAKTNFLFTIESGVSATFSGLTISDGTLAIYNKGNGTLTVTDCAFIGTTQGIYNTGTNANSLISGCTFSGNSTGFIYQYGAGTGTLTNCTFSNNSTSGITVSAGTAQLLTLINCTVSGNTAGINHVQQPAPVTPVVIKNTIVADNTSNFLGANATDGGSNFTGTQAKLGPLQDNGGPTQTMALQEDSPALNAGNDAIAPATDQRGISRPQRGQSDIGAFELEPPQSLIVTTTDDEDNGTSDPASGAGTSLREAITYANSNADTSTITFNIAGAGPFTINLATVLPALSTSMNIHNTLGKVITVKRSTANGTPDFRIFKVSNGTTTGPTVDISALTISNGKGGTDFSGFGGGILNDNGTLSLSDCTLSGNSTPDFGYGGGIFSNAFQGTASLTVNNCTFSGNSAYTYGGGICNNAVNGTATLNVTGSTFSSNSADSGGAICNNVINGGTGPLTVTNSTFSSNTVTTNGGGIFNNVVGGTGTLNLTGSTLSSNTANRGGGVYNNKGTLNVTDSTLSGNSADRGGGIANVKGALTLSKSTLSANTSTRGGGVYNDAEGNNTDTATMTVTNSTFSGNTATTYGGGIFNNGEYGTVTLNVTNATFSGNSATSGGGGILNDGGFGSATLTIGNTILKKGASGPNIENLAGVGTVTSQGYNLSDDAAGGDGNTAPGGFLNSTGDKRNTNPKLGVLQDNGGPTFTHLPADDSPAVSSGNTTLTVDQRGTSRPQGAADDIGAVEIVGAVNSAPSIDLNGDGSGIDFSATFTEDGGAVAIVDSDLTVGDTNDTNLESATVTITNLKNGTAESLAATTTNTNITAGYNSNTGVLNLTGSDTLAHYQTVLRSVTYNNTSNTPNTTSRSISFVVNDGDADSATATTTLAVNANNDAPVLNSIGNKTISGGSTLSFTASASDPENNTLTYSLVNPPSGATINASTGAFSWNTPVVSSNTNYSFTVKVTDNGTPAASAQETITVTVQPQTQVLTGKVLFSVTPTYNNGGATLVYKLQNGTPQTLTNISVNGVLLVGSSEIVVSRGDRNSKILNPRTGTKGVTWNNFSLAAGEEATLTVRLPTAPRRTTLSPSWTATWRAGRFVGGAAVPPVVAP